jgi:hypothetical protein
MSTTPAKPLEILDKMVDVVLAYRPKPKSKAAKKRGKASRSNKRKPREISAC